MTTSLKVQAHHYDVDDIIIAALLRIVTGGRGEVITLRCLISGIKASIIYYGTCCYRAFRYPTTSIY